jgi:tRNA G10  N-methylase Trm11
MPQFLFYFASQNPEFRMPEIDSLAHLFGTTVQYDPTTEMEDVCTAPICASYPVTSPLLSPDALPSPSVHFYSPWRRKYVKICMGVPLAGYFY